MPTRDSIHDAVVHALVKDGWEITHDPMIVRVGRDVLFIDLGAETGDGVVFGANRGEERIAVEVKAFSGRSKLTEFERAIGQFVLYNLVLQRKDPGRRLFLAVTAELAKALFSRPLIQWAIQDVPLSFVVVNVEAEEVVQWIEPDTATP